MSVPKGCGAERRCSSAALSTKTMTHGIFRPQSAGTTAAVGDEGCPKGAVNDTMFQGARRAS